MKLISLLYSQILCLSFLYAQTPPSSVQPTENNITNGHYFTDNNIDKFIGTWRWTSGTDTVIIALKKLITTYDDLPGVVFYQDWLYGCHTYIKNGQLIESSMQNFNSVNVGSFNIVGCSNIFDSTKTDLLFTKDNRLARYYLTLQYVVGSVPHKLAWHTEHKYSNNWAQILSLPRDMILAKQ